MATDSRTRALSGAGGRALARVRRARPHEARLLRQPGAVLALTAAILCFGVFSSGIGSGALPDGLAACLRRHGRRRLALHGRRARRHQRRRLRRLRRRPALRRCRRQRDAGLVYVFLGHGGALPTPDRDQPRERLVHDHGHAGEMLGYTIVGDDVNNDGLADIAIGAPMAGAPGKSGGGAVYVVFGSHDPGDVTTTALSGAALTTDPGNPARHGDRQPLRRLPAELAHGHVAGGAARRQRRRLQRPRRRRTRRRPPQSRRRRRGRALRQAQGVHITLNDLWENAYPYFFHIDFPALDKQHVGASVASVGDMTGDGCPTSRSARRRPTSTARLGLGLDHQRAPPADRRLHPGVAPPASARGSSSTASRPARATASTAPRPATSSAPRWPASETRTATPSATSRSAPRAPRRTAAPAPVRSSSSRDRPTRRRATSP